LRLSVCAPPWRLREQFIRELLEANDMAASVYVALSADASSSHKAAIDVSRDDRKSCFDDSSILGMRKT
jgi:hypothetical protein